MSRLYSINDVQHVLYINLNHRTDRKEHVEKELDKVGWLGKTKRFPGVSLENGAVGCSMSHVKCLEMAKAEKWDHVVIVEDDIEFLDAPFFLDQCNRFLCGNQSWDVLLLAGNNMLPYLPWHDNSAIQVMNCQTTTGYIVKKHYYDVLIKNYKEGIQKLLRDPTSKIDNAIDKYWLSLQRQDKWFLIVPLTVVQRKDYSDVEKKTTNYRRYMLDYNKVVRPVSYDSPSP
jgi:glycosyl transferase family 25